MSLDRDDLCSVAEYLSGILVNSLCDAVDYRLQRVMWIAAFHAAFATNTVSSAKAATCADTALDEYRQRFGG